MSKEIKYFTEKPPFINRVAEKKYLLEYFNSTPTNILFVYGPKSTGKTTLIYKIINENLNNNRFDINFINLRMVLMNNFQDFKNLFFPLDLMGKSKKKLSGLKIDGKIKVPYLGDFGLEWKNEDENMMKTNIFGLMEKKLRELNAKGIKPVIILDEFQYLKDIVVDKENNLLLVEELFKFFIGITKQFNLCHVVCLTSDSYYMEELYGDTKLSNTSDFYLMEHLSKKDIFYWLEDLEKIDKKIVDKIWKNLGGSVWEIWQILVSYKNTGSYKEKLDDLLQTKYGLILEWYNNYNEKIFDIKVEEKTQKEIRYKLDIFLKIIKIIVKKGAFLRGKDGIADFDLIRELVDKDIWFYDTKKAKITANSKSLEVIFKKLLKEIK